jgi:Concanavalin A-like lectin/glucanases superfamily
LNAPATGNPGLVGYWPFSEGAGTITDDASPAAHVGALSGASWTTGKNGKGLLFNGSSSYVALGKFDVPGSAITLAAWFNAETLGNSDPRIISKASGSAEQDHYFMLGTTSVSGTNRLRFRLKTNSSTKTLIASSGNVPTGQWVHAVATYNGSTMRLYLNGVLVGSMAAAGSMTGNTNVPVAIGRNPQAYGPFDGTLDQVRIYNRELAPSEISALYSAGQ